MQPNNHTWRTWSGDPHRADVPVVQGERTDVPTSTAAIPLTLYKRVNVTHLDSISRTGLQSTVEGVLFHGYSKGTPYAPRDAYLLAVWLGTTTGPGESMQPFQGRYANLTVKVSPAFRDSYLRDINAVLHGDDRTSGGTVLSFATIPPSQIFLTLTDDVVAKLKQRDPNTRLKPGETPLNRIMGVEFKYLAEILGDDENDDW